MAKKANKAAEAAVTEASDSVAVEANEATLELSDGVTTEEEINEADGLPIYHAPEGAEEE